MFPFSIPMLGKKQKEAVEQMGREGRGCLKASMLPAAFAIHAHFMLSCVHDYITVNNTFLLYLKVL